MKDNITDSFPEQFNVVVQLVLSLFFLMPFHLDCHILSIDASCDGCHACMRQTVLTQSGAPGCVIGLSDFS